MSSSEINLATTHILKKCINCSAALDFSKAGATCQNCERLYVTNEYGVWDFRPDSTDIAHQRPEIFDEAKYRKWINIFQEQESKNWVIYKNRLFRYFAQAGHRILGKKIRKNSSEQGPILEIGAGTGALLEFVPPENFVAVDMSMESLNALKSRWPNVTCVCASASALPFSSESFGQVVSLHTLEHLYFLAESMQEMRRVMRPTATLYYGIPTEGGLAFLMGRRFVTGPHLRKKYDLDVNYVMDREHINDAPRVLKFLHMHFEGLTKKFWPIPFVRFLSPNALIHGTCRKPQGERNEPSD